MNDTEPKQEPKQEPRQEPTKTPWHLWVVGVIGLLWNSMGVLDFIMTQTKNEVYMGSFSEEQLAYFYGFPMWAVVCWAIAVFGGLCGIVLLLLRSQYAVSLFAVSFLTMIGTVIYNYWLSDGLKVMGTTGAIFAVVIFLIALFLLRYSMVMKKAGVLK